MTHISPITISDLNTTVNHEPRILDTRLGEALGFGRSTSIRVLIERNRAEMERYGEVCITAMQTAGIQGGRPGKAYWLTEGQALCLSALSNAPNAPDVRQMLIEVYMAYRRGESCPTAAPEADIVTRVRSLYATGRYRQIDLARDFGLHQNQVSAMCRGVEKVRPVPGAPIKVYRRSDDDSPIMKTAMAMESASDALKKIAGPGDVENSISDTLLAMEDEILSLDAETVADALIQLRAVADILRDDDDGLGRAMMSALSVLMERAPYIPGGAVYEVCRQ